MESNLDEINEQNEDDAAIIKSERISDTNE